MSIATFTLPKPQGFSLTTGSQFVMSFPAIEGGEDFAALNFCFALDETWQPVGVRVVEQSSALEVQVVSNPDSADQDVIAHNLVRILNLTAAGDPFVEIGRRDPIVEHLRHLYPGLRPVQFPTPWETAAWAIIGHRIRMNQAGELKRRISETYGHRVEFPGGQVLDSFPSPEVVLSLETIRALPPKKVETLHGLAKAALEGKLNADHLLGLPAEAALEELQQLYGIGPFSAELILIRGAGHPDFFPTKEARLTKAMTALYGTENAAEQAEIAQKWSPYRSWAAHLIRLWLEDETQEIARGARTDTVPTPSFARQLRK